MRYGHRAAGALVVWSWADKSRFEKAAQGFPSVRKSKSGWVWSGVAGQVGSGVGLV
jgi:hypothetical protein